MQSQETNACRLFFVYVYVGLCGICLCMWFMFMYVVYVYVCGRPRYGQELTLNK